MSSADRRQAEILELLYMHEKCNVNDFVERFGVSRRTITSDIVVLTRKHNIKSKSGPHGGIEIDRDLKTDEVPYLTDFETSWLKRKYDEAEIEEDQTAAHSILRRFFFLADIVRFPSTLTTEYPDNRYIPFPASPSGRSGKPELRRERP